MGDSVPNLRPHVRPDVDGARCEGHCDHVGFMWRDFKRMEKAFWFCAAAIIGLIVKDVAMAGHGREMIPMSHPGELLGPDHVPKPSPPNE